MNSYLFLLMATVIFGLLPYIIGGICSFLTWKNMFIGVNHWFLIRGCMLVAVLGLLSAISFLISIGK